MKVANNTLHEYTVHIYIYICCFPLFSVYADLVMPRSSCHGTAQANVGERSGEKAKAMKLPMPELLYDQENAQVELSVKTWMSAV